MESLMKILNDIVLYSYKIVKFIGTVILTAIFLIITAGIVSRYVFNHAFSWTEELATFLMVWLCYLSAYLTTVRKKHIVADFFVTKMPEKVQKAIGILSKILMIAFFIVLGISVIELIPSLVWRSGVLDIHRKYYYLPVWTMSFLMAFAVFVDILNMIFPGYDSLDAYIRQLAEEERNEEIAETQAMQEEMDAFMQEAGLEEKPDIDKEKGGE